MSDPALLDDVHIVFFADQHLESAGGAQVSMRLQRAYLERFGHTVSVVSPRTTVLHVDPSRYITPPSLRISVDGEYAAFRTNARTDQYIDSALDSVEPVDVIHVQADYWSAFAGYRLARRRGLPVVHTFHTRVDAGIAAVLPFPGLAYRALSHWQKKALSTGPDVPADPFSYLAALTRSAQVRTAPSRHFAHLLTARGVAADVQVVGNGVDDGQIASIRRLAVPAGDGRFRIVWLGRLSAEKRPLEFIEALAESGVAAQAETVIIGSGALLAKARRLADKRGVRVRFLGQVPYPEALGEICRADLLVQTSVDFETQGLTVLEARALGTPSLVCDPAVAVDIGASWPAPGTSIRGLADTIRRAVDEMLAGRTFPELSAASSSALQSSMTARMLELYSLALEAHTARSL